MYRSEMLLDMLVECHHQRKNTFKILKQYKKLDNNAPFEIMVFGLWRERCVVFT